MAVITPVKRSAPHPLGEGVWEFYGTSAAASADTMTTPVVNTGGSWKLLSVKVTYSAAPTYTGTGLIVTIDDAKGTTYDAVLTVGTDNQRYFVYLPTGDIRLLPGDAILVNTASGGGVITAAVEVKVLQS